jgi:metal-responsive CopG/Arc/MetJ family transcriptional regulator
VPAVARVTVSLPADLLSQGEAERHKRGVSRSEYVADLYRHHLHALELQERVARYAVAYAAHPADPAEDAVVAAGAATLETPERGAP